MPLQSIENSLGHFAKILKKCHAKIPIVAPNPPPFTFFESIGIPDEGSSVPTVVTPVEGCLTRYTARYLSGACSMCHVQPKRSRKQDGDKCILNFVYI